MDGKMRHHRRPSKWYSFRWAIRTNLMNWIIIHLTFIVLCTLFCLCNRRRGTSPLKAEFLIWLKGVNFCDVLLCVFFSAGTNFADRGQSAKFAKIRTRKIFMLHGIYSHRNKPIRRPMRTSVASQLCLFGTVESHFLEPSIVRTTHIWSYITCILRNINIKLS